MVETDSIASMSAVRSPEEQSFISVAQIIAGIDDKYGLLADGRFEKECVEILDLIDETRIAQGYVPYDNNQRIILVRELYRVMEKFRNKKRRDGSSYFFEHLLGTVKILVKEIGLNGPASLIAGANHDSLEDLIDEAAILAVIDIAINDACSEIDEELSDSAIEGITKRTRNQALNAQRDALAADLVDTSDYAHLISDFNEDEALIIAESVQEMCRGVTKEKLPTVEETRDATLYKLLRVIMHNIKSVFIKFPDRWHNLSTLDGLLIGEDGQQLTGDQLEEAKAKQRKIIDETELIYLPLARRTRVRNVVRFFVEQCMNFVNPQLAAGFSELSRSRLRTKMDPCEGAIRTEFANNHFVTDVQFIPRGLDFYTKRSDKRFEDLAMTDLKISRRDPMFEILITTYTQEGFTADSAMEAVLTHVQAYFGAGAATKVEIERPYRDHENPENDDLTGIKVHVSNSRFGGHLNIRINDRYVEKKLDRGILANFQEKTPNELKDLIGPVLDTKAEPGMGGGAVDRGQRELLRNAIVVLDIDEISMSFPSGATVLDFASAIHRDVLWGAQGASIEDPGAPEGTYAMPVSLLDQLESGKIYFVDSCMTKNEPDRSRVRMHPRLLYFCQAPARKHIRPLLKDPWVSSMEGLTSEQQDFIAELNRKRQESIAVAGSDAILEKIHSLRERKPDGSLIDEQIIGILGFQDTLIDATGVEYLESLGDLFGVEDQLIRSLLVPALSLKPGRAPIRERAIINRAVAVGDPKANPLFVLATYFEKVAVERRPTFKDTSDRLCEVQIVVPDRAGELADFSKEFSGQVGVNLYDFRSEKRPESHEDVMIFRIDLDGQGIPIYDFLVKLLKLRLKYPTARLTRNPFMHIEDKKATEPSGSVPDSGSGSGKSGSYGQGDLPL